MEETVLATEEQARRNLSLASSRRWIVVNPQVKNALGEPVGYALLLLACALGILRPQPGARPAAVKLSCAF
jgi:primary-amine oxidase